MKKLTIIFLIFLSTQLIAQVNSIDKGSLLQLRNFERTSFSFEEKSQDSLPPISKGKIISEYVLGSGMGLGLSLLCAAIGAGIGSLAGEDAMYGSPSAALAFIFSYPFCLAYGVYTVGNIGAEEGSYWSTFWGTLGGIGTGILIGAIGSKLHDNPTLYGIALLCPSAGAVIGFNSSRRLETNTYSFKVEQNKYSILKPDFSLQLFRINF